jgi:N-formylmaleamate deformylase
LSSTFLYGANVRANGIRQHYLRFGGKGRPLVAVPGIITPAAVWGFVGERLGRTFDTHVMDVRGRGLSEAADYLDYSLDAYAADVVALAGALRLEKPIIVGHSMGARIAIRAARQMPDAFAHVVLVDPPVSGPGRRAYPSPLPAVLELLHAAQRGEAYEALTKPGVARWPEPLLRARAEWLHTCDERAVVDTHRGFHEDDIHADLPHIRVPCALIAATRGDVIRDEEERELRALLPSMQVLRVPDAGHQVPIDNFEGCIAALEQVLAEKIPA